MHGFEGLDGTMAFLALEIVVDVCLVTEVDEVREAVNAHPFDGFRSGGIFRFPGSKELSKLC